MGVGGGEGSIGCSLTCKLTNWRIYLVSCIYIFWRIARRISLSKNMIKTTVVLFCRWSPKRIHWSHVAHSAAQEPKKYSEHKTTNEKSQQTPQNAHAHHRQTAWGERILTPSLTFHSVVLGFPCGQRFPAVNLAYPQKNKKIKK